MDFLKDFANFTGKHPMLESLLTCNYIQRKIPAQVLSSGIYEIFKNTFFEEHLRTTVSEKLHERKKAT